MTGGTRMGRRSRRRTRGRRGPVRACGAAAGLLLPRERRGNPRWKLAGPVLVVLLLASGGGGYTFAEAFLRPPAYGPLWSIPMHPEEPAHATGAWLLDTDVVRGRSGGMLAYDQGTGKESWRLAVPGRRGSICHTSATTLDGVGAVTHGAGDSCDKVMAVDVRSGRRLWNASITGKKQGGAADPAIPALAADTLAVQRARSVTAFGARQGKHRWTHRTKCPVADLESNPDTLLLLTRCQGKQPRLIELDPARGSERHSRALSAGKLSTARIAHVAPTLIVAEGSKSRLLSVDDAGKVAARIPVEREFGELDLDTVTDPNQRLGVPFLVRQDTLLATVDGDGTASMLTAFDLGSGELRWRTRLTSGGAAMLVRNAEAGPLLVFDRGTPESPPRLLRVSVTDGATRVAATYAKNLSWMAARATILGKDGRLFLVSEEGIDLDSERTLSLLALGEPPGVDWLFWRGW